mgnify:CR=1 FL=1|jgi:16S rRNA (guanine(966)-N(2))-methyltransferase RsmD
MRIISGNRGSRKLRFPKSKNTRPMMDRAKGMIFNILSDFVREVDVLDLFAGSGSLGLECLSRGARHVTFVENGPWAKKSLLNNLETLGLKDESRVIFSDVFRAIGALERQGKTFSLIFLDPPYNKGLVKKILNRLERSVIVTPLTQLILHHSRQELLPESLENFKVLREKQFGQACLSFLSRREQPHGQEEQ